MVEIAKPALYKYWVERNGNKLPGAQITKRFTWPNTCELVL